MTPGQSIRAVKFVDPAEDYFADHFPGFPVVPGVLLTEMMAQTAGKCLDAENPERGKAMLAKINSATFRKWVQPDTTVTILATIQTSRSQFATADCHIEVDSKTVASANLLFSFVPMKDFAPDFRDEVLERFQGKKH